MIQKENNKIDIDQAWHQLYARLEQDELLPEEATAKKTKLFHRPVIRWAAAIIVLCVSIATGWILSGNADSNLLTLHNEKGSVTLVTTLEDGSIVYLSDDTQLRYPEHFDSQKREVLLKGNALFDVSGNSNHPFLIETEFIRVEVIGTAFNVQSTDNNPFELSVQRGEVKVTHKESGESLHVKAGETATLLSNRLQIEQTSENKEIDSFTGQIRFKDERLSDILTVINKRSSGIMLQATESLKDRQLTVTFDNESPEAIANLICIAFNLSCKKEMNVLLISEP